LNRRKGPAVFGLRACIDRDLYRKAVQDELNHTPNLEILEDSVEDILHTNGQVQGITTKNRQILSKSVVITTGTFLRGQINIGLEVRPAGRIGDEPSIGLANSLETLGFNLKRLKTGTPPRIRTSTIDFKKLVKKYFKFSETWLSVEDFQEIHLGDDPITPFSFLSEKVWIDPKDQLQVWMTYSNEKVKKIIEDNMHLNLHVREEVK
jgi:tRNA uridine 5-carboxymethylaminomethyl modification enzyme